MMNAPLSIFILKEIVWRGYRFTQIKGFLILEFHPKKGRRFTWDGIEIIFLALTLEVEQKQPPDMSSDEVAQIMSVPLIQMKKEDWSHAVSITIR